MGKAVLQIYSISIRARHWLLHLHKSSHSIRFHLEETVPSIQGDAMQPIRTALFLDVLAQLETLPANDPVWQEVTIFAAELCRLQEEALTRAAACLRYAGAVC